MKDQLEKQRIELEERIKRLESRPGTPNSESGGGGRNWRNPLFRGMQ